MNSKLRYTTDVTQLTAEDYTAACELAEVIYSDYCLGCDVLREVGKTEECTEIVEYKGVKFEVWLESRIPYLS